MSDAEDHLDLLEEHYFPTIVFRVNVQDADELNAHVINQLRQERDADQKGIKRSNVEGWHSHNHLHKDDRFTALHREINQAARAISKKMCYDAQSVLRVDNMWGIINGPGSYNESHIHPDALWSGVYYAQAPEKCGDFVFSDPRTANLMTAPARDKERKRPQSIWRTVYHTPKAGKMLIFPSWLYHAVEQNLTTATGAEAERIIVSFNLSLADA